MFSRIASQWNGALINIKGVELDFSKISPFLTGAQGQPTLDFQILFSAIDRPILDLATSLSKFFFDNTF